MSGDRTEWEGGPLSLVGFTNSGSYYDHDALECPACGGDYLHQQEATVIWRESEDGKGVVTVVGPHGRMENRIYPPDEIEGRRDVIEITFACEYCPAEPVLIIRQAKGRTFLSWKAGRVEPGGPNPSWTRGFVAADILRDGDPA
jgi:hypothetical protein